MNRKSFLIAWMVVLTVLIGVGSVAAQQDKPPARPDSPTTLGTAFTYQGELKKGTTPVTGSCSFHFSLWDAASGGTLINTQLLDNVPLTNGRFTVSLDFGATAFPGDARWLQIEVMCAGDTGFSVLTPRQALTLAPYTAYALNTGALQNYPITTTAPISGQVLKWNGAIWRPDTDNVGSGGNTYSNGFGLSLIGNVFNVLTDTIQARVSSVCSSGSAIRSISADGTVTCEPIGSADWSLTGNSGTGSNNFLGTTDDVTLTFRVSNTVGLRLTSNSGGTPNVVGGYFENAVAPGVTGATIAGGGYPGYWFFGQYIYRHNRVTANFGTIGGGLGNVVTGMAATIGGGYLNDAYGNDATVSGGYNNIAWDDNSTIGGGANNVVQGNTAAIGGGNYNFVDGYAATIPGGEYNTATMSYTLAAGHQAKANHQGAFVWADSTSADFASTANDQFLIRAHGGVGINTNAPARSLDVNGVIGIFDGGTRTYNGGVASELGGQLVEMGINDDVTNRFGGAYTSAAQGGLVRVDARAGQDLFQFYGRAPGGTSLGLLATLNNAGVLMVNGLGSDGSSPLCYNASHQIAACSSSLRYKDNIETLPLGLDTIAKLRPVTFNWKDTGQADLGFVAEDVSQVTPLLTTLNKDGQIEGVKYDRISAVLVKAMQEQQQQIEALTAQNAAQQLAIAQLKHGTAQPDPSLNFFNVISVIALGGVIAIGLHATELRKRGARS